MSEEVTTEVAEEAAPTTVEASEKAFVDTFLEQITDESVKGKGFWKNLSGKDANEVGSYIAELQSWSGKKGDIPKPDAPPEEWDAFHQKLGRPESMDGYDFGMSEEFKQVVGEDQIGFYEQAMDGFKEQAFAMGASPEMADKLVDWYFNLVAEQYQEVDASREKRLEEGKTLLKNEWGENQNGIELGVRSMLKEKGGMEDADLDAYLQDPKLAIALAKISAKFDSDPELGSFVAETQAGLQDQMAEVVEKMREEYARDGRYTQNTLDKYKRLNSKINS